MSRSSTLLAAGAALALVACIESPPTAVPEASLRTSQSSSTVYPDVIPLSVNPEGIAVGTGHTFYTGNLVAGSIHAGDLRTGAMALVRADDGRGTLGLKHDARSGYLFMARGGSGWGTVIDAGTGAVIADMQFAVGSSTNPTFVNDVVVTNSAAYFTDSRRAVLYRVPLQGNGSLAGGFSVLPLTGDFVQGTAIGPMTPCLINNRPGPLFANGIEATPNGKWLIVNSLANGVLYRVDPATGEARTIDLGSGDVCLADGNLLHGKTLYVMQNLLSRMAVVELSNDYLSGTVVRHIQGTVPMTTMARFGNSIYAVTAGFGFLQPPTAPPGHPFQVVRFDMK